MTASRRPADTRIVLGIVEQQLTCAASLLKTLEQERQALLGNAMDALEQVSADKLAAANQLQTLSQSLEKINAPPAQIEQLAQTAGSESLRDQWHELLKLAALCQSANLANGALLDERQSQIRRKQNSIASHLPASTYGRGGNSAYSAGRRSIASA